MQLSNLPTSLLNLGNVFAVIILIEDLKVRVHSSLTVMGVLVFVVSLLALAVLLYFTLKKLFCRRENVTMN